MQRVGATDMDDIKRRFRQCCQCDGALGSLTLQDRRTCMSMIDWSRMTSGDSLSYDEIDSNTILSVHHNKAPQTGCTAQHAIDRLVINHEGAWIGHQQFEGRYTCVNHLIHRLFWSRGKVGNCDVKAVIYNGLTLRFAMPGLQGFSQAVPALLIGEINDGGSATTGSSNCSRLKVIAGNCRG